MLRKTAHDYLRATYTARIYESTSGRQKYSTEAVSQTAQPAIDTKSNDYQRLPASTLPTYYFQKSLPRLAIPKLELTAQRYLDSVKCILSSDEFKKTQRLVQEFQTGAGLSKGILLIII